MVEAGASGWSTNSGSCTQAAVPAGHVSAGTTSILVERFFSGGTIAPCRMLASLAHHTSSSL